MFFRVNEHVGINIDCGGGRYLCGLRIEESSGTGGGGVTLEDALDSFLKQRPCRRVVGRHYAADRYIRRNRDVIVAAIQADKIAHPERYAPPFGPAV